MLMSPTELIAEKGETAIADATGAPVGTVRVWKSRNRIPRAVWPELMIAFPDLSAERLKEIEGAGATA